jgi:hypothetical protein
MDLILVATWAIVAVMVAAYLAFVVWRIRVHRRKSAPATAPAAGDDARLARALEAAARIAGTPPVTPPETAAPLAPAAAPPVASGPVAPVEAEAPAEATGVSSVAELLAGIKLPNDLAPLTTMAPRAAAGDRVAFWTDTVPMEIVGPSFIAALALIGCEVTQLAVDQFSLRRKGARAMAVFYPDGRLAVIDGKPGFPSVPAAAFVVEVYLPALG